MQNQQQSLLLLEAEHGDFFIGLWSFSHDRAQAFGGGENQLNSTVEGSHS